MDNWCKPINSCSKCKTEYQRKWRLANQGYNRQWKRRNRESLNAYERRRYAEFPLLRLQLRIAQALRRVFRGKVTQAYEALGCSVDELQHHLRCTFAARYLTDYNPELHDVHIDHVVPASLAQTEEDLLQLQHYTNLQLLLAEDNLTKGASYDQVT